MDCPGFSRQLRAIIWVRYVINTVGIPYCRYGFSWICATVSSSDKTQLVFDDHGANHQPGIFCGPALAHRKALIIALRQCIPRNAPTHPYPAVDFIKSSLKRPVKLGQRQLFRAVIANLRCTGSRGLMSFSVHYYAA